jgi:hypothetical protein
MLVDFLHLFFYLANMKNVFIILLAFVVIHTQNIAQEYRTWRAGVSLGLLSNPYCFDGGMENADARFAHNSFVGGNIELLARYDYTPRVMFSTGLVLAPTGYAFTFAQPYSLRTPQNRFIESQISTGQAEIPLMAFYKSRVDCKQGRWLFGGGFSLLMTGKTTKEVPYEGDCPVLTVTGNYLTTTIQSNGGINGAFKWSVGRERILRKGRILNVSLAGNIGLGIISQAKVEYVVDNQYYMHQFVNRGNYTGIKASYFFQVCHK